MKQVVSSPAGTSDRIIAAAGTVFADQGFQNTTVRQITARAQVNVAAVNYHFRDKAELYARVLAEAKRHVSWIKVGELTGNPDTRLLEFIRRFVSSLLDPKRPAWHGRVLALEMANPTPALEVVIKELTAPLYRDVRTLMNEVVRGQATPAELDLLSLSVMGQCVFYVCSRPMVERLAVDLGRPSEHIEQISRHIGNFSLGALRAFRRQANQSARSSLRRAPRYSHK